MRKTDTGTQPYFTRAEIEQGALANKGLELLYLADPVDVFFMHIQGSGRIHLTDGTTTRINYDGKNGHPYTSIGRYLVEKGLLDANKVSMQKLCKWLRDDPERGKQVMWQNASFIFFRELKDVDADAGPMGALSVPLTPGRSLAVDPTYAPLGSPVYVSAPTLPPVSGKKGAGFNRLMVAQDVGSAIKGPERGDIYFGSGDKAGKIAGVTKHPGNFFVLVPVSARRSSASSRSPAMADDRQGRPLKKPGKRGHDLSAEERALWEHAARTLSRSRERAGCTPRRRRMRRPLRHARTRTRRLRRPVHRASAAPPRVPARAAPLPPPPAAPPLSDLDRRKARKIGTGKVEIDGRIDLHGMRQAEAHAALRRFLMRAYAEGRRWLLVITGKGAPLRRGEDDEGPVGVRDRRARSVEAQRAALACGAGAAGDRRGVHDGRDPPWRRGRALRAAAPPRPVR